MSSKTLEFHLLSSQGCGACTRYEGRPSYLPTHFQWGYSQDFLQVLATSYWTTLPVSCILATMLWIIILLESVAVREYFIYKWYQACFKNPHIVDVIMPVNSTTGVAPLGDIPPHTCTCAGCFALGLSLRGSPIFQ